MAVCIIKTKVLSMGSYLKDQEQLSCMQIRHVLLAGKTQRPAVKGLQNSVVVIVVNFYKSILQIVCRATEGIMRKLVQLMHHLNMQEFYLGSMAK